MAIKFSERPKTRPACMHSQYVQPMNMAILKSHFYKKAHKLESGEKKNISRNVSLWYPDSLNSYRVYGDNCIQIPTPQLIGYTEA